MIEFPPSEENGWQASNRRINRARGGQDRTTSPTRPTFIYPANRASTRVVVASPLAS